MDAVHSENPDNPFSLKIKSAELYSNPIIDQFFSILLNSIGGKDFLILVIGESQSGKTTFLYKLISQIEQNVKPCQIKVSGDDGPASNDNYYPAFFYETEHNQVIIVDDAHNLNYQELSIILKNAWDGNKKTKQVVLFCEPKINQTISSLLKKMPKKTSVNKLYMPSFDKKQTESYIKHYLRVANFSGKFSFSEKNIKNISGKSKGLPGKINFEAHKIFSDKNLSASNTKQSKFNPIVIVAITTFIIFIIGGFVTFKKPSLIPVTSSSVALSENIHKTIAKKIPVLLNTDPIEPININEPINIGESNISESNIGESNIGESNIGESNISESININEPINIAGITTEMPSQKGINKPDPIILKSQIIEPAIENKTASSPSVFQEQWIMKQKPQDYTIQIMAAKQKDGIERFLKLNINTQSEIAYYKMYSNGELWYKIISGKYKTLKKARTACNNLPGKLKNAGPWPRHFASIHNDINKFIKINKPD